MEIAELVPSEAERAVAVLARGMRDNPTHVAALGPDPERRERRLGRLFGAMLASAELSLLVAREEEGPVAVLGMAAPGACLARAPAGARLRFLPALLSLGPGSARRTARWLSSWGARDPAARHWHLGPVAVDRGLQGRGIGSRLLEAFRERVDAAGEAAYLETDKPENVRLYRRFGFELVDEAEVLGTTSWFMSRPAPEPGALRRGSGA